MRMSCSWLVAICVCASPCALGLQAQEPPGSPPPPPPPPPPAQVEPAAQPKPADTPVHEVKAKAGETREFPEFNCALEIPAQWEDGKGKREPGGPILKLTRKSPEMLAYLTVEDLGDMGPEVTRDNMALMACSLLSQQFETAQETGRRLETFAGIEGIRVGMRLTNPKGSIRCSIWVGMHQGIAYRLTVNGPPEAGPRVELALTAVAQGFKVLDPKGGSKKAPFPVVDELVSKRWGAKVSFPANETWRLRAPGENAAGDDAEVASTGGITYIGVNGLELPVANVEDEALVKGLMGRLGFGTKGEPPEIKSSAPEAGGGLGRILVVHGTQVIKAHRREFRLKIRVQGNKVTYVMGWAAQQNENETRKLEEIVEGATLGPAPETEEAMTPGKAALTSLVCNEAGIFYYRADRQGEALPWFRRGNELSPGDVVVLANLLGTMLDLKQFREGVAVLDRYDAGAREKWSLELRAREARLREGAGDMAGAVAAYLAIFESGRRDDEMLESMVALMRKQGQAEQGLRALDKYASGPAKQYVVQRASLLLDLDRGEEAVALLLPLVGAEGEKADGTAAYTLADVYEEMERYSDEEALCRRMIAEGASSGWWQMRLGRASEGLKWYAKAKEAYEKAVAKDPKNKQFKDDLARVSGLLGQGDNTELKTVIAPVEIAAELTASPAEVPRSEGGLVWDVDVTAVEFVPQKVWKRTTFERVRVLNRSGVDRLSTLQYEFHGPSERIHVNRLRVTDSKGKVTDADVSTFYVLSEHDSAPSSMRVAHLPVPGLEPGSVVEVEVTVEAIAAPKELPLERVSFEAGSPVGRRVLVVKADPALVKDEVVGEVEVRREAGGVVFVRSGCEAFVMESMLPHREFSVPCVTLGSARVTWESEAREYLDLIKEKIEAGKTPAMEALAKETVGAAATAVDKTRAIARYVQKTLAYRAVEFGRRAQIPRVPAEVLADKLGDCKDQALVVHSLLAAAGVESYLTLVRSSGPVRMGVPDQGQFDHVIVYVPGAGDGGTFIDTTGNAGDVMTAASRWLGGASALVLDGARPRFVVVPRQTERDNVMRVEREVRVAADGTMRVKERTEFVGGLASWCRGTLDDLGNRPVKEWLAAELTRDRVRADVTEFAITGREDPSLPMVITCEYACAGGFARAGEKLAGKAPAAWEGSFFWSPTQGARRNRFEVVGMTIESKTRVVAAEGMTLRLAESGEVAIEGKARSSKVESKVEGDGVVITATLVDHDGLHEAGEFAEYVRAGDEGMGRLRATVEVQKK